jgi:hypothetical protein
MTRRLHAVIDGRQASGATADTYISTSVQLIPPNPTRTTLKSCTRHLVMMDVSTTAKFKNSDGEGKAVFINIAWG